MIFTVKKFQRLFDPDEWAVRLLNLPRAKALGARSGLVMIQIDGLGFTQFERAARKGNMPFLARLMKKRNYVLKRHYTGLPSNTPGVQGALFYGVQNCVPAFSFKDSASGKVFNMFNPESASAVEDRLKEEGVALLSGGSAYGNIFTGGAKEARFCASSMGWGGLLKAAHPLAAPLTILLNFHIFIRVLFLIILEFILAVSDAVVAAFSGKNLFSEIKFVPFRVVVCVFLREVIAAGARIDITRGLPVIHINLGGYDEQAHHRGPKSVFAHWSLRGIDGAISKIWKAAKNSQERGYKVFIYSDHGQEETLGYREEHGETIQAAVNKIFEEKALWKTEFTRHVPYWRARSLRNTPLRIHEPAPAKEAEVSPKVIVAAMGPVGLIYLPEKLSPDEKENMARRLVTQAQVPIVMIADGPGRALAWNAKGKFVLPAQADQVLETTHPFFKEVAQDLVGLCHQVDAGDLILFGWRKGAKSLTFHGERGSHAGPGPEETSGFALLPAGTFPVSGETICTQDIRRAALHALDREPG